MFKALNGLSPSYLSGIISFWNPVCNLRNKENKLPNLEQAILNVVLVTSLLPKMLIVKLGIPIDSANEQVMRILHRNGLLLSNI